MLVLFLLTGCNEPGDEAPVDLPEEVPVEAPATETPEPVEMTELQRVVGEYEAVVVEKLAELEQLKEKVQEIPIGEMMDEQARVVKGAMEEVAESLGKMMEELVGHLEELAPEPAEE